MSNRTINTPNAVKRAMKGFLFFTIGLAPPAAVMSLVTVLILRAAPALRELEINALISSTWAPESGVFGLLPLIIATIFCATLATLLCFIFGLPAAVRLAFLAGDIERRASIMSLTMLSALPSVLVGLACLDLVARHIGLSVASAVIALFIMTWPSFTLLLCARLAQEGDAIVKAACALGIERRTAVYCIVLKGISGDITRAVAYNLGKAMGEAMAVSFVIGNIPHEGRIPNLMQGAHTLTTMVLKDHGAATGDHHAVVYMAILLLGLLVIVTNTIGSLIALRLMEHR